jgi:hypothetical protein
VLRTTMEKIRSKKDEANEKIAIMVTAIEKGEFETAKIPTLEQNIVVLDQEKQKLIMTMENLHSELKKLKIELHEQVVMKNEKMNDSKRHQEVSAERMHRIARMETDIDTLRQENVTFQTNMHQLTSTVQKMEKDILIKIETNNACTTKISNNNVLIEQLNNEIAMKDKDIEVAVYGASKEKEQRSLVEQTMKKMQVQLTNTINSYDQCKLKLTTTTAMNTSLETLNQRHVLSIEGDATAKEVNKQTGLRKLAAKIVPMENRLNSSEKENVRLVAEISTIDIELNKIRETAQQENIRHSDEILKWQRTEKQYLQDITEHKLNLTQTNNDHRKQVTDALIIQREAEEKNNFKIREEHKIQLEKNHAIHLASILKIETTYKEEMLSTKEHNLREKKQMVVRHEAAIDRLTLRYQEDKQRSLEDCMDVSRTETELALQENHRLALESRTLRDVEWHAKLEDMQMLMEDQKEKAVASCLSSTLEEMTSALELEQKKRREQVRATREEWRLQMKLAVDKSHIESKERFVQLRADLHKEASMQMNIRVDLTKNAMKKEFEVEKQKLNKSLNTAIERMKNLHSELITAEKRCKEAEAALKVSRIKRQQNFEEMNQMYTAQALREEKQQQEEEELKKHRKSTSGGLFSRMFGSSTPSTPIATPERRTSTIMGGHVIPPTAPTPPSAGVDYTTITGTNDFNALPPRTPSSASTPTRNSKKKKKYGSTRGTPLSGGNAKHSPGGTPRGDPIGLGLRYATLIESYSAMMGQVELLGDQLLEERNTTEEYKEKNQDWIRKEKEYVEKIATYRSRLDAEMALSTQQSRSRAAASSPGFTEMKSSNPSNYESGAASSSFATGSSSNVKDRRLMLKVDALEGHVVRLRDLLQKGDAEQDDLREDLLVKTKQLRHHEVVHEQSLKKLMFLQNKEMERGRYQIEREQKEKEMKIKNRRTKSITKQLSKRSTSFFGKFNKTSSDNNNKVKVPLRGGNKKNRQRKILSNTVSLGRMRDGGTSPLQNEARSLSRSNSSYDEFETGSRSTSPVIDSPAVESAREKLLLGKITKEEFLQVIAADASKRVIDREMGDGEEEEDVVPMVPPRRVSLGVGGGNGGDGGDEDFEI